MSEILLFIFASCEPLISEIQPDSWNGGGWGKASNPTQTEIDRRSQNSYTARVMVSSAPIGGIRVFAGHTRGNKCKQNAFFDLRALCGVSRMFISTLRLQYIRTWRITVILIKAKTQIPLLEPSARIKMTQVLDLWSISVGKAQLLAAVYTM